MTFDLVLRGGTVIDGTGGPPRTADVAIRDGAIALVGRADKRGRREIDADGAVVTPGFVDIHTHYDGQATWDARLQPSSAHGVATVVMGNCGVGYAPVRPADRDRLIELMEGVEDLPGSVLHEGLPWNWETIEEYLNALDSRPHDIDFAAQVCHAPLRLYVMGERGANRAPASSDEIAEMGRIAARAARAGAPGIQHLSHYQPPNQPGGTDTFTRRRTGRTRRDRGGRRFHRDRCASSGFRFRRSRRRDVHLLRHDASLWSPPLALSQSDFERQHVPRRIGRHRTGE